MALEGAISKKSANSSLARGEMPQGDLIPWTIGQQFQDPDFPSLSGARVVRIAVHPDMGRAGYGSRCEAAAGLTFELHCCRSDLVQGNPRQAGMYGFEQTAATMAREDHAAAVMHPRFAPLFSQALEKSYSCVCGISTNFLISGNPCFWHFSAPVRLRAANACTSPLTVSWMLRYFSVKI